MLRTGNLEIKDIIKRWRRTDAYDCGLPKVIMVFASEIAAIERMATELEQESGAKKVAESQIKKLEDYVATQDARFNELKAKIDDATKECEFANNRHLDAMIQIRSARLAIHTQDQQIRTLGDELASAKLASDKAASKAGEFSQTIDAQADVIAGLRRKIASLCGEIEALNDELAQAKQDADSQAHVAVESVRHTNWIKDQKIAALNAELAKVKEALADNEAQCDSLRKEIAELATKAGVYKSEPKKPELTLGVSGYNGVGSSIVVLSSSPGTPPTKDGVILRQHGNKDLGGDPADPHSYCCHDAVWRGKSYLVSSVAIGGPAREHKTITLWLQPMGERA